MGAVFAIPYARMPDWYGGLAQLRGGFLPPALTPYRPRPPSAPRWAPERRAQRVGLLLGTEGDGLFLALAARGRPVGVHPDGPLAREGGPGVDPP